VAERVQLVEAPDYVYKDHPLPESKRWRVLTNASPEQIQLVWVDLTDGRHARMYDVEPCTMYATASDAFPVTAHFKDSNERWRRPYNGDLSPATQSWPTGTTRPVSMAGHYPRVHSVTAYCAYG
jgi:hypothetical protein